VRRILLAAPAALLLFILPYPGTVALRLLCLAIVFVIAAVQYASRDGAVPALPCKVPIALWAAIAAISLAYAVDPAYSAGEIKNEIGYTMMAFVSFLVLTRDDTVLRGHLLALAAGAALLCLWILAMRLATGTWNESAGHGGRGIFATYAVTLLPVLMLLAYYFEPRWQRTVALLLLALLLATAIYSQQRIIWAAMAAQAAIAFWLLRRGGMVRLSRRGTAGAIAAVILVAGLGFLATQWLRFNEHGAHAVTVSGDIRTEQVSAIVNRILEQPISGSGFGREAMKKAHGDLIPANYPLLWHAHNSFLNYGLGMGLPGVAALLFLFLCLLRQYWKFASHGERKLQLLGMAGMALVAGVFVRNQVNDFFARDMAILFWALNGMLLGLGLRILRRRPA
jgi:O-antigen ligase